MIDSTLTAPTVGSSSTFTIRCNGVDVDPVATTGTIRIDLDPGWTADREFLERLRVAMALSAEREAECLRIAHKALITSRDDPTTRIPVPERSTARRRRQFSGRVCSGSSRYRVMV